MAIYKEDIVDIELTSGTIHRGFMNHAIGYGDNNANRFGVRAFRNGEPAELGGTCAGYFINAAGNTVVIASGTVNGNVAYVTLPEECYAVEGNFTLAIKASLGTETVTMRIVDGTVSRTCTDTPLDPGNIIEDIEDLIDAINTAVASIPEDYSELEASVIVYKGFLSVSDDIDDFLTPGLWYLTTTPGGVTPDNWPSTTIGQLAVFPTDDQNGNGTVQRVTDYNGDTFIRYKRAAGFTAWHGLLAVSDIATKILPFTMSMKYTPSGEFNVDDLRAPGMYTIGDVSKAINWPSNETGRLIVFGDKDSGTNRIVQMAVDNNRNVMIRYISAAVQPWFRLGTEARGTIGATDDCNNYTKNGQFSVSQIPGNWFSEKTGKLIVFGDENNANNRIVQLGIDYSNTVAIRYKSSGWTNWEVLNGKKRTQTIYVSPNGGGTYTTVPAAVKAVMDAAETNANTHYLIKIAPGTYDIADDVVGLIEGGMEAQGLWIPPNTTICGAGKDKTIIRFLYDGDDDDIMAKVSAFNMPYESTLMDCTIIVKNIRYCIHSALQKPGESAQLVDDVNIRLANVKLVHEGFDSDKTPSYKSPGTFGSGSTNGGRKEFYNCEFIARQYCPWFNHNRKNLTKATEFIFEGCSFISENTTGVIGAQAALHLITWTDNPKNYVIIRHCTFNRFVHMSIRTDIEQADPNAHNGYYITADCDLLMYENTTNNAQLDDNWMDINCRRDTATSAVTAFTPLSKNAFMKARPYNSADKVHGIALHNAAAGEPVVFKTSGLMMLPNITGQSFAVGKKIGWDGTDWVEDNNNPIMEVVYSGVAEII